MSRRARGAATPLLVSGVRAVSVTCQRILYVHSVHYGYVYGSQP